MLVLSCIESIFRGFAIHASRIDIFSNSNFIHRSGSLSMELPIENANEIALIEAAAAGNIPRVRTLIEAKAKVEVRDTQKP